jgi:hypothetical protein
MARENGEMGTWEILNGLSLEARLVKMRDLFLRSMDWKDDKLAALYFSFLLQCISDRELAPFIIEEEGKTALYFLSEDAKKLHDAKARAGNMQAQEAIELYNYLFIRKERAGFPKTKSAMLTFLAKQWQETGDDEEADMLFDYLTGSALFPTEEKFLLGMFREATDGSFPADRLSRHIARLVPHGIKDCSLDRRIREIARVLLNGWARSCAESSISRAAMMFRSCQPLLELRDTDKLPISVAFDLQRRESIKDAEFHAALLELFESFGDWGSDSVPGKKLVLYLDAKRVEISIAVPVSMGNYRFDDELLKKDGNKWYEMARDRAKEWRKKYMQYSLYLKLSVHGEFSPEPRFNRGEEIDLMP